MSLPTNRTASSTVAEHLTDHNTLHGFYNLPDASGIRYVAAAGSDSNDGLSWAQAFATVEAAIASLPTTGSGSTLRHEGTIHIGIGVFETEGDLECNGSIKFYGSGSTYGDNAHGTTLKLVDGAEAHMFVKSAAWTDFAHHVQFADMTLDGNKANQVGDWDLIVINKGGFNCLIKNIFFRNASGWGLRTTGNVINLYLIDTNYGACETGAIYLENGAWMLGVYGGQIDNCGVSPIRVDITGPGNVGTVLISGVKVETSTAGLHQYVVHCKPRTAVGGNPQTVIINGLTTAHSGAGGGQYVVYEEDQVGHALNFNLSGIEGGGSTNYTYAFLSDKRGGVHSISSRLAHGVYLGAAENDPKQSHYEVDGIGIQAGTGSPENVYARPVGSLYFRKDGGATTTLYVKESGTGVTGWVAK